MKVCKRGISLLLVFVLIFGVLPFFASAKSVSCLTIMTKPTKTVYRLGQKFSKKGMKVVLVYSDRSTEQVTNYKVKGFKSSSPGLYNITVTYDKYTSENSFGINVKDLETPKVKSVASKDLKSVTVKWKKVIGAKGYIIYKKKKKAKSWTKAKKVAGGAKTTYIFKKLTRKATFSFTVQAYRGKMKSGYNTTGKSVKVK